MLQAATVPAFVKDVCQTMNMEQMERKKKRKRERDISYMCSNKMVREDISTCYRVRKVKKDENSYDSVDMHEKFHPN